MLDHSTPGEHRGAHVPRQAWTSVAMATVGGILIALALGLFAVAYALGGAGATEDNWVGYLCAASLGAGFLTSLLAFAMAIVVAIKGYSVTLLWLPLALFPTLAVFLILGEAFWWE